MVANNSGDVIFEWKYILNENVTNYTVSCWYYDYVNQTRQNILIQSKGGKSNITESPLMSRINITDPLENGVISFKLVEVRKTDQVNFACELSYLIRDRNFNATESQNISLIVLGKCNHCLTLLARDGFSTSKKRCF